VGVGVRLESGERMTKSVILNLIPRGGEGVCWGGGGGGGLWGCFGSPTLDTLHPQTPPPNPEPPP